MKTKQTIDLNKNTSVYLNYLDTAIGILEISATEQGVSQVLFVENPEKTVNSNQHTEQCKQQLQEYFTQDRKTFDLELDRQTGTEFQQQVWQALMNIPFGQVASYRDIATTINNPKAVRAVGAANGKNPISIIVPCHRIIGANGTLTGYAGGLTRKQWLLQHESGEMFKL